MTDHARADRVPSGGADPAPPAGHHPALSTGPDAAGGPDPGEPGLSGGAGPLSSGAGPRSGGPDRAGGPDPGEPGLSGGAGALSSGAGPRSGGPDRAGGPDPGEPGLSGGAGALSSGAGPLSSGPDMADPAWSALTAELISLGRSLVAGGLVLGSGGNLSARPAGGDLAAVTARGTWLDRLTPANFSLVRLADGAVLGGAPAPSTEVALHLECYRARPDVMAVVHVHPQMSVLLTALGQPIRLITTDHVAYVRQVRVAPYRHPGTPELATEAAALLADGCDCVVLAHHGCSVVAHSVEMALRRVLNLEEAARLTHAALLLGDTSTDSPPGYRQRLRGLTEGQH
jgi:L-fuculose-phosphate aldolase